MTDESWVFDSLICFLHSPSWNAALSTFIEEKSFSKFATSTFLLIEITHRIFSTVFDPNIEIDVTSPEHVKIFDEYKNLVWAWNKESFTSFQVE